MHKPNNVFLCETLAHKNKIVELKNNFTYDGRFSVDRLNRSDGLAVLWKNANIVVLGYSVHFIDLNVLQGDLI